MKPFPWLFRMGVDRNSIMHALADRKDFREPLCRSSLGVSTDEPWPDSFLKRRPIRGRNTKVLDRLICTPDEAVWALRQNSSPFWSRRNRSSYIIVHLEDERSVIGAWLKYSVDQAKQLSMGTSVPEVRVLYGRRKICGLPRVQSGRQRGVMENRARIIAVSHLNMPQPLLGDGIVAGCCSSSTRRIIR